jgi:hypothetical protein
MNRWIFAVAIMLFSVMPGMAYQAVNNVVALDRTSDLTTPSSTQKYPLGLEVTIYDSSKKSEKAFVYAKASQALTAYRTYVVNVSSEVGGEWKVGVATAPASGTNGPVKIVVIPQVAFSVNEYGFFQNKGDCTAYCVTHSTCGTLGYVQSGSTTGIGISGESATANTKQTKYTVGISKKTAVAGATTNYMLFGVKAQISNVY